MIYGVTPRVLQNLQVKVSRSKSNVTLRNIAVAMHDSSEVIENDRSGDDNSMIVVDDGDYYTNMRNDYDKEITTNKYKNAIE